MELRRIWICDSYVGGDLTYCDFENAPLLDVLMMRADLSNSTFNGANMLRVNATDATIGNASFVGADMREMEAWGADFTEADLTDAIGVASKEEEMAAARYLLDILEKYYFSCIEDDFILIRLKEWDNAN